MKNVAVVIPYRLVIVVDLRADDLKTYQRAGQGDECEDGKDEQAEFECSHPRKFPGQVCVEDKVVAMLHDELIILRSFVAGEESRYWSTKLVVQVGLLRLQRLHQISCDTVQCENRNDECTEEQGAAEPQGFVNRHPTETLTQHIEITQSRWLMSGLATSCEVVVGSSVTNLVSWSFSK